MRTVDENGFLVDEEDEDYSDCEDYGLSEKTEEMDYLKSKNNMKFKIVDKKTGTEPTSRVIHNIAKKGGLMEMDIDQFFVGEDGSIVLADDCGNIAYVDMERFIAVRDTENEQLPEWVTNGDVIVTLFPNMKVEKFATFVRLSDGEHYIPFGHEWWNEPYKKDED